MKKIDRVILSEATKLRSRRISTYLFISVLLALLVACGDDNSSNSASNSDEESSSSVCKNCDDSSSSKAKSSSSSAKSSSSEKKPCVVGKDKNCFEDERDGQTYRTVKIGTQIWMAENLNFKVGNSACYDDEKSNCTKYGRLYTWGAAIDSVGKYGENAKGCGNGEHCTPIPPVRGICPEGWHLPDTTEWRVLIDVAGGEDDAGKALKSKSGWKNDGNGTDEFGFSALPVGGRFGGSFDGDYFDEGLRADFWTSSYSYRVLGGAIDMGLMDNSDGVFMDVISSRVGSSDRGYSIRCLSDESTIPEPKSSSSESSSSSLMQEREPCDVETDENCIKDERDGHTYRTVKIGEQTWMAENLNYAYTGVPYKFEVLGKAYTSDSISWCYNDSAEYCARYGRFYTWSAVMDSAGTTKGCRGGYMATCSKKYPFRSVCPEGWHLPEKEELGTLVASVGGEKIAGKKLKSTYGWENDENGTDEFGFSAFPAGQRSVYGLFNFMGEQICFWSANDGGSSLDAYCLSLVSGGYGDEARLTQKDKSIGRPVRCVKDE